MARTAFQSSLPRLIERAEARERAANFDWAEFFRNWLEDRFPPNPDPVHVYEGTEVTDVFRIGEFERTSLSTYGGNDHVHLFGGAEYEVDLGDGDDSLYIRSDGAAKVSAGAGDDFVAVNIFSKHDLDGGAGIDTLSFNALDHGIRVDLMSGEAYINQYDARKTSVTGFEEVYGTRFSDLLRGDDDDNILAGFEGNDQIFAEGGDDVVTVHAGANFIDLGDGNDTVTAFGGGMRVYGGAGDDVMTARTGGNDFYTGTGADVVQGGDGDDRVHGGARGDDGADQLDGGDGAFDTLDYMLADAAVTFDVGQGTVTGLGAGVKTGVIDGQPTVQVMTDAFANFERFQGTAFDDVFLASDSLFHETFFGGAGDDLFHANLGSADFIGGLDPNRYPQSDVGTGFDVVSFAAFSGAVEIDLGTGSGRASFDGSNTTSKTYQFVLIDGLIGGTWNDVLIGDDGDNLLDAGARSDDMTGNGGADTFRFTYFEGDSFFDTVTDFTTGEDLLHLAGMQRGGETIASFADLDTNGDGRLTDTDDAFSANSSGPGYLLLDGGMIELLGVDELAAEDFLFG